jgi:hypothetical protein
VAEVELGAEDYDTEVRFNGTGVMIEDLYGNQIFMNQEPIEVGK